MTTCKTNHKGFTLLEMLVYISILVIISVLVINIAISLARFFSDAKQDRLLRASAETALERIEREVRFAKSIDTASSTLGVHPGKLVLTTIDPFTETPQTVLFLLDGTRLGIKILGTPLEYLTSNDVDTTNLVFRRLAAGTVSEAVRTELTIGGKNFYAFAILRRSY